MESISSFTDKAIEMAMEYAPKIGLAIAVIVIGLWIIKRIVKIIDNGLTKTSLTKEIATFLSSIISIALKVLLLFSVAEIVGIETTSFVAVLAAAGFALGLALQGSLGNFAAGVVIILFKPYKIDDWVEIQDKFGKVADIQIFNTILETPGRKTLIIPNGQVIDGIVTNYSMKGYIRIELKVSMPYSESFPEVQKIIYEALNKIPKILSDPIPEVGIENFDSHSIVVSVRPYVKPDDYWEVTFDAYSEIKKVFNENQIPVAYSEGVEMGTIGN